MKKWTYKLTSPKLDNETCLFHETLFHNANGYLGVRSCFEEGYDEKYDSIRGTYINGFYDFVEVKHAEKLYGFIDEKQVMLNIADTQGIEIYLDDERFSMFDGEVLANERILDLMGGTTKRVITWRSPLGKEVKIEIIRMASHALLNLFTIEYKITPLYFSGNVKIVSSHKGIVQNYANPNDPRVSAVSYNFLEPVSAEIQNDASILITRTTKSDLSVASAVQNILPSHPDVNFSTSISGHEAKATALIPATEGGEITMVKYASFTDSIRYPNFEKVAVDLLREATSGPLDFWYDQQRSILAEFWEQNSLEIKGDPELDLALRYNIYQLFQSAGRDKYSSVSAKGLSGEGYEGHYFWDTEIYIQPFFILNHPEIAKGLLSYRYSILDEAREHARIMGHKQGALYPWRTIMGTECSGYFPSGSAQYHINGAIAWSVLQYYFTTGDQDFMVDQGAEILFETARLWLDAGNYHAGKFHIYAVSGPDEYTCVINDNFYTNLSAQNNLAWAARIYRELHSEGKISSLIKRISLQESEINAFEEAAQAMYLPYDDKLEIHAQDESFLQKPIWDLENTPKDKFPLLLHYHPLYLYRYQICKQADTVLAYFLFGHALEKDVMKRSYKYYEKITTHDSSLSACMFSIVASQLGMNEKANYYFGDSAKLDLFNTHGNTKDGLHTANLGGSYMAIVYGFGGLRIGPTKISFSPKLPEEWEGYQFQINYRGSLIKVNIAQNGCEFALVSGQKTPIYVYGEKYLLEDKIIVSLS